MGTLKIITKGDNMEEKKDYKNEVTNRIKNRIEFLKTLYIKAECDLGKEVFENEISEYFINNKIDLTVYKSTLDSNLDHKSTIQHITNYHADKGYISVDYVRRIKIKSAGIDAAEEEIKKSGI